MKPGERIELIRETAESLSARDVPLLQTILHQFGVNTWNFDDGYDSISELEYCYRQLEDVDSEILTELHEYVVGGDNRAEVQGSETIWSTLPLRVFISHIHDERTFAGAVKTKLEGSYGASAFVAHQDINPSKAWRDTIKAALSTCDLFVALLHPGFHRSQWCDQEAGWALARDIPLLPVRVDVPTDRTAVDGFLEEKQDIVLVNAPHGDRPTWVAEHILLTALNAQRTRQQGVRALVEGIVAASSQELTTRFWRLVERHRGQFDSSLLRRLEFALQTNPNVYNAQSDSGIPIPELVTQLTHEIEPPSRYDEEPF